MIFTKSVYCLISIIKLMSSTQSITELASSLYVKDAITFTLNSEFLNHNFEIVKQCLLKIKELENSIGKQHDSSKTVDQRMAKIEKIIVENTNNIKDNNEQIKKLQNNVGDEFMRKMYAIEEKTKNMYSFQDTVDRLLGLEKFLTVENFKESESKLYDQMQKVMKIKEQLERYVPIVTFQKFTNSQQVLLDEKQKKIQHLNEQIMRLESLIQKTNQISLAARDEVKQNAKMIKEINFAEMLQKIKKFKEDMEQRMTDLSLKMKKKVGTQQLLSLQQQMIDKLDKFLTQNEKSKAQKTQTKDALLFLQKRISQIEQYFAQKASEEDKDALFSAKKWQCASCTKDLGKFEGKLGQYRPWAIFPCKQLDPQKTGGFGYLNYIDKMSYKKGASTDDQNLQRLSKTFYDQQKQRQTSQKKNQTSRGPNLINNYGSDQKPQSSLKEVYFRQIKTQGKDRTAANKFRVKKDTAKQLDLERAKDI